MLPTTREDFIRLLAVLGVDLPPRTKLSDDALEKHFRRALDCAQDSQLVVPPTSESKTVELEKISKWGTGQATGGLQSHMWRATYKELSLGTLMGDGVFTDLRESMAAAGNCWDIGQKNVIFSDREEESGICVRLISAYAVDKSTPLIVVLYLHDTRAEPKGMEWVHQQMVTGKNPTKIFTVLPAQKILLHALETNAKRIPKGFTVKRETKEKDMTISYLMPIGPIEARSLASLNMRTGCSVCGEKADKKCVGCYAILYCSEACQRANWKEHKPACKTLKGAIWAPITFSLLSQVEGPMYATRLNANAVAGREPRLQEPSAGPPPNTHGTNAFIVKLQYNARQPEAMLLYDRRQSVDGAYPSPTDAEGIKTYGKIVDLMPTKGVGPDKIYCWARRTGEWTLDVAIDRLPVQSQDW